MKLTDVRRLTGVNFLMDANGAVGEAQISDTEKGMVVALWRQNMRLLLDAVGWQSSKIATRSYPGGCSIGISAPIDALFTATDMIETTWGWTQASLSNAQVPDLPSAATEIKSKIAAEKSDAMIALDGAANDHDVTFLGHDGGVSVGLGTGCKVWADGSLPDVADVDWTEIHDVPVALVTGTNGKSTTVRLAAAIGAAAGRTVGLSSSDWVRVGNDIVDEGDYSGPAGARLAVRDPRVDLAVIETARGGLMRRGLPIPRAEACLITNVAADHLGDYGITDVPSLADAKFLVARAVRPGGCLVLNGDDPELVSRSVAFGGKLAWYGLSLDPVLRDLWIASEGITAFVSDGVMMLAKDGETQPILAVNDFGPGLKGAAKFNISNALGAIALAAALDLPPSAMTRALSEFENTPKENPGRGNFIEIGGITLLIDFAHNPHGVAALAEAVADVPAKRRLIVVGQAGDRSDDDTRELTRAAWKARPDMVVVKELVKKLRGRSIGELPAVVVDELRILGAAEDGIIVTEDEISSVYKSLEWARPGDFLVLLLHENRAPVMALLDKLASENWQAGSPLPD